MSVKLTARCVGCGDKKQLTERQLKEAEETGCPMCDTCFMPMIVESAATGPTKKKKTKKP